MKRGRIQAVKAIRNRLVDTWDRVASGPRMVPRNMFEYCNWGLF